MINKKDITYSRTGKMYHHNSRINRCSCGNLKKAFSKSCKECGNKKISNKLKGRMPKNLASINKNKNGAGNPNWKGGRTMLKGYSKIMAKGHLNADRDGYVFEHRLVMEKKLGRYLTKKEVVHHIDGNPRNNRILNLRLFKSVGEHTSFHRKNRIKGDYHN